ncbi:UNVERIFIED_CONTAM: hypothetical protein HDU68_010793 [Siphonaria sp. JEL0065]|nr:hypothetical protein HDU68_010793 [Siphonaria sp. JEL0065]
MKINRVSDLAAFDSTLASVLASAPGRVFVVVFASEDPTSGQSWCPDCVISDPLIRKAILKVPDSTLIEAPAGDRPTWKNPDHPYRKHEELKATNVPTLYEFGKDGKVVKTLIERAITEESLALFIQ